MNTEIEVMDKTIKCLALELHEVVWKDVAEKWNAVKLAAASTVSEAGEDAIEVLKDIMLKFGNAHDMLAKSKLTKEEYQPISSLLAKGKIELFNFYQLYL